MNNKVVYPNNKFRNPNNFKEVPITPVSPYQERVVKMPNEGSKQVRTYYVPPGQESSWFGRTIGKVSNTIQSLAKNPFKRTVGGSLAVVAHYNKLREYSDEVTKKKIKIFKFVGSFGKANKSWLPEEFLKKVQVAVHDPYYKLTFKHSEIYRALYHLYSTLFLIQQDMEPTAKMGPLPDTLSEPHIEILRTIKEKDEDIYDEEFTPYVGMFDTLKQEAEDDLHEFVKAIKEACLEIGGENSMTNEEKGKMNTLLDRITAVISLTGSPKSSSAHGGARKTKRNKQSHKSHKSQSIKRLHRRM